MGVDHGAHFTALGKPRGIDAAGQGEIADGVVVGGRIAAEGEGAEGRTEIARASVGRGLIRDENVGRKIGARPELVRDHAPHARILNRRARPVTGEHRVRAAFVGGLAMGHGPDDGDLVGDLRSCFQVLRKINAVEAGFDAVERAAVFDRGGHLGVEGFLVRHATRQVDVDNRLGLAHAGGERFTLGAEGLRTEKVTHGHADRAQQANVQKFPTRRPPEVGCKRLIHGWWEGSLTGGRTRRRAGGEPEVRQTMALRRPKPTEVSCARQDDWHGFG